MAKNVLILILFIFVANMNYYTGLQCMIKGCGLAYRFACMGSKRVTVETAAAHRFARTGDARILARSAGAMLSRLGCDVVKGESMVGSLRTQMVHETVRYLAAVSLAWMKCSSWLRSRPRNRESSRFSLNSG